MLNRISHQQVTPASRAHNHPALSRSNRESLATSLQPMAAPTFPQRRCREKVSILLIDDEAGIRILLSNALMTQGYQCQEASDGLHGLALWQTIQPDLVLLDISMPGMDGFEVLQEIRRCDPMVGIIMVSALDFQRLADKALAEAVDGYIKKPFRTPTLFQEIDRVSHLVSLRSAAKSSEIG